MEFRNSRGLTRNEQARANENKPNSDYIDDWKYTFNKRDHEAGKFKIINRFSTSKRCATAEEALDIYNSMKGRTTLFCGTFIIKQKQG